MNHVEDDYAALHAYLKLAEVEIDEVISGRLVHKQVTGTEDRPLHGTATPRTDDVTPVLKNKQKHGEDNKRKPPKGFQRENRAINKRTECSDRKQVAACFGFVPVVKSVNQSNLGGLPEVGTGKFESNNDDRTCFLGIDQLHVDGVKDLCVGDEMEDRDVLLERILSIEGKREDGGISQHEDCIRSCDSGEDYAEPVLTRMNQPPADLNKLLVSDRYSLLLGTGLNFLKFDNVAINDCRSINSACPNVPSLHMCSNTRKQHIQHQYHHRTGETQSLNKYGTNMTSLPIWPNYQQFTRICAKDQLNSQLSSPSKTNKQESKWNCNPKLKQPPFTTWTKEKEPARCWTSDQLTNQSSASSKNPLCLQSSRLARSGSEKDIGYELRQRRRTELLTQTDKDGKCDHRSLPSEESHYLRPIKLIPPSTLPAPLSYLSLHRPDVIHSKPSSSSLVINEQVADPDLSSSDRSGTDSELQDLFNPPSEKFTSGKPSRSSYPNDDNPIITPPPGFNSPKMEEEMWVKVRLVTRSHDHLSYKSDKKSLTTEVEDDKGTTSLQYYAVPFEFETTSELSKYYVPQTGGDHYLPDHSPIEDGLHKQGALEYVSGMPIETTSSGSISKSSRDKSMEFSVPWIRPVDNSIIEEPSYSLHNLKNGQCVKSHNSLVLEAENSDSFVTSNESVHSLTLTDIQSDLEKRSSLPPTNEDCSTSKTERHGQPSAEMTSRNSKVTSEKRRLNGTNGESSGIPTKFPESFSNRGQTESGETPTNNIKSNSDCDLKLMLDAEEDNNNNNRSINLLSMCLASNCKHLASCRSKTIPESPSQEYSKGQPAEYIHKNETNQLVSEKGQRLLESECTNNTQALRFPKVLIDGEDHSDVLTTRVSSDVMSNITTSATETSFPSSSTENRIIFARVEAALVGIRDFKLEPRLNEGLHLSDTCCKHMMEKAIMKDTAVQTSLDMDSSLVDISDNISSQKDLSKSESEGQRAGEREETSLSDELSENKDTLDKKNMVTNVKIKTSDFNDEIRINRKNDNNSNDEYSSSKNDQEKVDFRKSKARKSSKASFLRSKSIHGSELGQEEVTGRSRSPDLTDSLRELSHLNIDVSQKLVNGEERFIIDNDSAELQVIVNALTPVLSRRNRARNARRLQHTSPVKETSKTVIDTMNEFHHTSPSLDKQNTGDKSTGELQNPDSCSKNLRNIEANAEGEIPLYTRLKSYEGLRAEKKRVDPNSLKQIMSKKSKSFSGRKTVNQIIERRDRRPETAQSTSNVTFTSTEKTKRKDNSELNTSTGYEFDFSGSHDDLDEELEKSRKCLFLSSKLAHTWHGAPSSSTHRSTPRMGVSRMLGDGAKFVHRQEAGMQPVAETHASDYDQNSYTMPVISRTLLDALHKRYCSHQYSGHYQTLQPFTLLKLDSTFSSGNQSITALLLEPRRAIDHEVHAAPPSPEIIARFRMLTATCNSKTEKDSDLQTADQEQSGNCEGITIPQPPAKQLHDQLELPKTIPVEKLQDAGVSLTPNSSPNLRDVSKIMSAREINWGTEKKGGERRAGRFHGKGKK